MRSCVFFVIDESSSMSSSLARDASASPFAPVKTKAESVATLLNAFLNRISQTRDCDLGIIGYTADTQGNVNIGSRWGGTLSSKTLVHTTELSAAPLAVEKRTRRVPDSSGISREQTVDFPVWYQPSLSDKSPQVAAFEYCGEQLSQLQTSSGGNHSAPIVIHIHAGASSDGNPLRALQRIQQMNAQSANPTVVQIHLGSSSALPTTAYPVNRAYLAVGPMRDLFERASPLPETWRGQLKSMGLMVGANARSMVYNAQLLDLSRILTVIESHLAPLTEILPPQPVTTTPTVVEPEGSLPTSSDTLVGPIDSETTTPPEGPPDESPLPTETVDASQEQSLRGISPENPALVLFVLDRSVEDPYSVNTNNACNKLSRQMSELAASVAKNGNRCIDIGIVSYGGDSTGETDVRSCLEGNLAGRMYARDDELSPNAIRTEQTEEEMSDGVGGIIKVPRKRLILVEVEPTVSGRSAPAFAAAANVTTAWWNEHATSTFPVMVVHMTRGKHDATELAQGIEAIQSAARNAGKDIVIYHSIATESPHVAVNYPTSDEQLTDTELRALWQLSSPVYGAQQLAEKTRTISGESRGIVVNSKLTCVWDALNLAIQTP